MSECNSTTKTIRTYTFATGSNNNNRDLKKNIYTDVVVVGLRRSADDGGDQPLTMMVPMTLDKSARSPRMRYEEKRSIYSVYITEIRLYARNHTASVYYIQVNTAEI